MAGMHLHGFRLALALLAAVSLLAQPSKIALGAPSATTFRMKLPNGKSYNLTSTIARQMLAGDLERFLFEEQNYLAKRKAEQNRTRKETSLARMSFAELKAYYAEPLEAPTHNELRSLCELQSQLMSLEQPASQSLARI